ncbi:alpha-ketoacid dehydrogenase subunit beta [Halovulum dunhuangense]|uniref:Alpha-ketoacid dehydrogenase subunit beta n=2 Tax=Halovulum dunhuangense TaxID=1505036 RepID=A0A849L5Z6_9RHOB|nr:alpha-ketoacid dehydrogenase subunit beta [Halovulum dunhuangense]
MTMMTMMDAIDAAIAAEMRTDPSVLVFGEGVATKRTALRDEFGAARVRNTPLAEGIIAGTAAGAAATGLRPIVDLLFAPFLCYAMDEIVNAAGKLRYLSGGQFSFPMVVLAHTGGGWGVGGQHNHNLEAWFAHAPGLKVAMPSTPADAWGLMRAAIRDDNPVLIFTDMALAYAPGELGETAVPIGQARVAREGSDVTLIGYGKTVPACLEAAAELARASIAAEVLDLRSLKPLDEAAILRSVRKTGRVVIAHEASRTCGIGAEVAAMVADAAFASLRAPVRRLTGPDAPVAACFPLEAAYSPAPAAIAAAARDLMGDHVPRDLALAV